MSKLHPKYFIYKRKRDVICSSPASIDRQTGSQLLNFRRLVVSRCFVRRQTAEVTWDLRAESSSLLTPGSFMNDSALKLLLLAAMLAASMAQIPAVRPSVTFCFSTTSLLFRISVWWCWCHKPNTIYLSWYYSNAICLFWYLCGQTPCLESWPVSQFVIPLLNHLLLSSREWPPHPHAQMRTYSRPPRPSGFGAVGAAEGPPSPSQPRPSWRSWAVAPGSTFTSWTGQCCCPLNTHKLFDQCLIVILIT